MIRNTAHRLAGRLGLGIATIMMLSCTVIGLSILPASAFAPPIPPPPPHFLGGSTTTTYALPDGKIPFASVVYDDWTIVGSMSVKTVFGATVSNGTVTLTVDGWKQCSGVPSSFCVLQLPSGAHQIAVSYSGYGVDLGSSAMYTVDVQPIPTTTKVNQEDWNNILSGPGAWWQATVSASPVAPSDPSEILTAEPALSSQNDNIDFQCVLSSPGLPAWWSPSLATGLQSGANDTLVSSKIQSNPYCPLEGGWQDVTAFFSYPGDSVYGPSSGWTGWSIPQ